VYFRKEENHLTVKTKPRIHLGMRTKKKARPVVLTIRLSDEEHRIFLATAKKRGLSLSSLIRTTVLAEVSS
jgi:hypothetical protein